MEKKEYKILEGLIVNSFSALLGGGGTYLFVQNSIIAGAIGSGFGFIFSAIIVQKVLHLNEEKPRFYRFWIFNLIFVIAISFFGLTYYQYENSKEESEWITTKGKNSSALYQKFIENYPKSIHSELAAELLENAVWKESSELNSIFGLEQYLLKYSNGKFSEQAKKELEELYWNRALIQENLAGYTDYYNHFPTGKQKSVALNKIEYYEWLNTKEINTFNCYSNYLNKFPNGVYGFDCDLKREEVLWDSIIEGNNKEGYIFYLSQYPKGKYSYYAEKLRNKLLNINLDIFENDEIQSTSTGKIEPNSFDLALQWEKSYKGGNSFGYHFGGTQLSNGNIFIAAGDSISRGVNGANNIFKIKLMVINGTGKIIWEKFIGGIENYSEQGTCAIQANDNSIIIGGMRNGNGWIAKISPDGTIQWEKQIEHSSNNGHVVILDITLTKTGEIVTLSKLGWNSEYLLSMFSSEGAFMYNSVYKGKHIALNFIPTKDNDLKILGVHELLKTDNKFQTMWNFTLENNREPNLNLYGISGVELKDGAILLVGTVANSKSLNSKTIVQNLIIKIDQNGNMLWRKDLPYGKNVTPRQIIKIGNDRVILFSYEESDKYGESKLRLLIMDNSGVILKEKIFTKKEMYFEPEFQVFRSLDGGVIVLTWWGKFNLSKIVINYS